jgi:hypothetical protein
MLFIVYVPKPLSVHLWAFIMLFNVLIFFLPVVNCSLFAFSYFLFNNEILGFLTAL